MKKTLQTALIAISIVVIIALTGCSGGILGSQHTSKEDRNNYSTIQDTNGTVYSTVVRVQPSSGNHLSSDDLKKVMSDANINWYQMIVGNNMSTNILESAYVYFPKSTTFNNMVAATDSFQKAGYNATVLYPSDYQAYIDDASTGNNIYYNETTFFGPAATHQ